MSKAGQVSDKFVNKLLWKGNNVMFVILYLYHTGIYESEACFFIGQWIFTDQYQGPKRFNPAVWDK